MPTKSPSAWHGSWCKQLGSGHTNTLFFTSGLSLLSNFHGTLCRLRCIWRFWSLWNPWLHISHTYLSDSSRVLGDNETTSASGSGVPAGLLLLLLEAPCSEASGDEEKWPPNMRERERREEHSCWRGGAFLLTASFTQRRREKGRERSGEKGFALRNQLFFF